MAMGEANINEQRWSQRRLSSLNVKVFSEGLLLAICKSRDVGLGGVYLETDTLCFKLNQEVELFFSLGDNGSTRHKLKAKIVRSVNDGIGLIFKDFDTSSFRTLQEIMRSSKQSVH